MFLGPAVSKGGGFSWRQSRAEHVGQMYLIVRHAVRISRPAASAELHTPLAVCPKCLDMQTFNSAFDSLPDHVIAVDLCLRRRVGVMEISGRKSILMTHGQYVFAGRSYQTRTYFYR